MVERERDGEEGGEVVLARSGGEARNEAKQLFHRKAGIESQSPVVTLMRASVRAPEQEGPLVMAATAGVSPSHRIASHRIFFWKWKWKWKRCMQCDSAAGGGLWVGLYCT